MRATAATSPWESDATAAAGGGIRFKLVRMKLLTDLVVYCHRNARLFFAVVRERLRGVVRQHSEPQGQK